MFFHDGRKIPVYFAPADPAYSYAFDPPAALPWAVAGLVIVLLGSAMIFFV
jgi:hypothetical protein